MDYISVGHSVSLMESIRISEVYPEKCTSEFRLTMDVVQAELYATDTHCEYLVQSLFRFSVP